MDATRSAPRARIVCIINRIFIFVFLPLNSYYMDIWTSLSGSLIVGSSGNLKSRYRVGNRHITVGVCLPVRHARDLCTNPNTALATNRLHAQLLLSFFLLAEDPFMCYKPGALTGHGESCAHRNMIRSQFRTTLPNSKSRL